MKLLLISVLSLGTAFAATADAQEAVQLEYQFSTTKPLVYRITRKVESTQKTGEETQKASINETEVVQYRLLRIDKSNGFVLERRNLKLAVDMKIGRYGSYRFNSEAETNEVGTALGSAFTPVYEALAGSVIQVTVSQQGEVLQVKGREELLGPIIKDKPLARQLVSNGTDAAARQQIAQEFAVFSGKAVRPDDKWDSVLNLQLRPVGDTAGKREYKFVGVKKVDEQTIAALSSTSELDVDVDFTSGGVKTSGTLKIDKSSGDAHFDLKSGTLVSRSETFEIGGEITVRIDDADVEVETTQTHSLKVEKLDTPPAVK